MSDKMKNEQYAQTRSIDEIRCDIVCLAVAVAVAMHSAEMWPEIESKTTVLNFTTETNEIAMLFARLVENARTITFRESNGKYKMKVQNTTSQKNKMHMNFNTSAQCAHFYYPNA